MFPKPRPQQQRRQHQHQQQQQKQLHNLPATQHPAQRNLKLEKRTTQKTNQQLLKVGCYHFNHLHSRNFEKIEKKL